MLTKCEHTAKLFVTKSYKLGVMLANYKEASITFVDKAKKTSNTSLYANEAQVAAYNTDPTAGDIQGWFGAIATVSLLNVQRQAAIAEQINITALPTDDQAYRSAKLMVFFHDPTTDDRGHFQVPGRDPSKYNTYPGTKDVILTVAAGGTAEIEALITATQLLYTKGGNHPVVDSIVVAGGKQ